MIDVKSAVAYFQAMDRPWRFLAYAVAGTLFVGLLLPASPTVERVVLIDARPATVFSLLNDFRQANAWSSLASRDPNSRVALSGPPSGIGASIAWDGRIVGQGRQTIVESVPFERIIIEESTREAATASHTITLAAEDDQTRVTWAMQRHFGLNLPGRFFGLWLDGVRGPILEEDLSRLADMAASLPPADFSDLELQHIFVESTDIAYVTTTSEPQATAVTSAMGDAFFDILNFISRHGLAEAGAPLSITRRLAGSSIVFDAAIPIRGLTGTTPRTDSAVKVGKTYEGSVVRARHTGAYATLGETHEKVAAYLTAKGIARNGDAWESYVSDPERTDETGLTAYVYYPIRN